MKKKNKDPVTALTMAVIDALIVIIVIAAFIAHAV
jgi:hypothetical protein